MTGRLGHEDDFLDQVRPGLALDAGVELVRAGRGGTCQICTTRHYDYGGGATTVTGRTL